MGRLVINQDKVGNKEELVKICPFGALEIKDDKLDINSVNYVLEKAQKVQLYLLKMKR